MGQGSWEQGSYDYKVCSCSRLAAILLTPLLRSVAPSSTFKLPSLTFTSLFLSFLPQVLPLPNASEHEDASQGASWSYDPSKREFITYDTPNMASLKTRFVRDKGLRGAMYWELSGDRDAGDPRAIVPRVAYEVSDAMMSV